MSAKLTGLVLEHLDAAPGLKVVATILADHADHDGICWPSQRRIAAMSKLTERSVGRHVRELIELGVVTKLRQGTVVKTPDGKALRVTNAYQVHADVLAAMPSLVQRATVEFSTDDLWRADTSVHLGPDTSVRDRWTPVSTKPPYKNHHSNHQSAEPVDNPDSLDEGLAALAAAVSES